MVLYTNVQLYINGASVSGFVTAALFLPYSVEHCAVQMHYISLWHKNNERINTEKKNLLSTGII